MSCLYFAYGGSRSGDKLALVFCVCVLRLVFAPIDRIKIKSPQQLRTPELIVKPL